MICFDTTPLILSIEANRIDNPTAKHLKALAYLKALQARKEVIMIPTPVVAEFLCKYTPEQQADEVELLERNFAIYPFDLPSSIRAARLHPDRQLLNSLRTADVSRQHIKVDLQVLAIAIHNGASSVVSEDPHVSKLAQGKIVVHPIPDIDAQAEMFQN